MPDQSSASTEHALMQEITGPLATLPDDAVPVVAGVAFPTALRGYDRLAVDAYVQKTSQLVAELQATRSPEAAIRRALERVGSEVAGILQRAHDTADQITTQSRTEAEDRLEVARQEAAEIVARAEERVRELDAETDRIWAERHRIVEDTRELARELLTLTDSAADRFPPDPAAAGDTADVSPAEIAAGESALLHEDADELDSGEDAQMVEDATGDPEASWDGDEPGGDVYAGSDIDTTATLPIVKPDEDDTTAH